MKVDTWAKRLDFQIVNMHWAQLQNNFTFTANQAVAYEDGETVYKASSLKCSQPIPVEPGSIWRISTRSSDVRDWPTTMRGVFVDGNQRFVGFIPVDDDDPDSGISTFTVPEGAAAMIVNARQQETNQDETHILKLCDWENLWDKERYGYTIDHIVNHDGHVVPSEDKMAVTGEIPVNPGDIYRLANVHTGDGKDFTQRGVFLNDAGQVVGPVPDNTGGSLPYPFNDVIVPVGATKMRVNFFYKMQTRVDTSGSLTINKAVPAQPIYNSEMKRLRNKVWAAYGDSFTYYADWVRMVENATGLSVYVHGYGGASANDRGDDNNYLARDDRIERLMSCNPDIVTILTGANWRNSRLGDEADFQVEMGQEDRTTFYGAFAYIIKKIYSLKQDVTILILEPTYNYYGYKEDLGFKTLQRAEAVRRVADYFGLPIAPTRAIGVNVCTQELMFADNVHLSMAGAEAMARIVIRELKQFV